MDLITGKCKREVFFDPALCTEPAKVSEEWLVENLFSPVVVVQALEAEGVVIVSTEEGRAPPPDDTALPPSLLLQPAPTPSTRQKKVTAASSSG